MKRDLLERQLNTAKTKLESRVSALKAAGIAEDAYAKDPDWRNLDATRRQAATRLVAVGAIEKREADALARKEGGDSSEE